MTNEEAKRLKIRQNTFQLVQAEAQLDYWTPRYERGESLEAEEQHLYWTKMMRYLITSVDKNQRPVFQNGTNLVFPSR